MPDLHDITHNLPKPKVKPENMYPLILPEMRDTLYDKLVTIDVTSLLQACDKYDKLVTSLSTGLILLRDVVSCVCLFHYYCLVPACTLITLLLLFKLAHKRKA